MFLCFLLAAQLRGEVLKSFTPTYSIEYSGVFTDFHPFSSILLPGLHLVSNQTNFPAKRSDLRNTFLIDNFPIYAYGSRHVSTKPLTLTKGIIGEWDKVLRQNPQISIYVGTAKKVVPLTLTNENRIRVFTAFEIVLNEAKVKHGTMSFEVRCNEPVELYEGLELKFQFSTTTSGDVVESRQELHWKASLASVIIVVTAYFVVIKQKQSFSLVDSFFGTQLHVQQAATFGLFCLFTVIVFLVSPLTLATSSHFGLVLAEFVFSVWIKTFSVEKHTSDYFMPVYLFFSFFVLPLQFVNILARSMGNYSGNTFLITVWTDVKWMAASLTIAWGSSSIASVLDISSPLSFDTTSPKPVSSSRSIKLVEILLGLLFILEFVGISIPFSQHFSDVVYRNQPLNKSYAISYLITFCSLVALHSIVRTSQRIKKSNSGWISNHITLSAAAAFIFVSCITWRVTQTMMELTPLNVAYTVISNSYAAVLITSIGTSVSYVSAFLAVVPIYKQSKYM